MKCGNSILPCPYLSGVRGDGGSGASGGADVVTAIPRISDTVMHGCYYGVLEATTDHSADVQFYRLDGTKLYVSAGLSWQYEAETGEGYWCDTGEVTSNPELSTISASELAYLAFKFYALFKKGNMDMGHSLQDAFGLAMTAVLDDPDYDGPTPVFIF